MMFDETTVTAPAAGKIFATEDPVIALIAEEERIRDAALDLSDASDTLFFALPEAERRELVKIEVRRLQPGEMGELEQAELLYGEANRLLESIRKTKPVTVAGAIALLECMEYDDETVDLVVEFLRELQASVGASASVPIVDTPPEEPVARESSVEGSPAERRLFETYARFLPEYLAAVVRAEQKADRK
jgi:hypothetical protein